MARERRDGRDQADLEAALAITYKRRRAGPILDDPDNIDIIAELTRQGFTDIEIASLFEPDDPKKIAKALQTEIWARKKAGEEVPIPRRSPEQDASNRRNAAKRWREEHKDDPDFKEKQRLALEKTWAANTGRPRVYTQEAQAIMRRVLEEEQGTYQQAAEALREEMGLEVDKRAVQSACSTWNITNNYRGAVASQAEVEEEQILTMSRQGMRRRDIVTALGEDRAPAVHRVLHKNNIRERVDWQRTQINGVPLKDLASQYGYDGYEEFNRKLEDVGLGPVSRDSFNSAISPRRRK